MAGRVVASELYLPHGLRWRDGALWFTDEFGGTVCRIGSGAEVVARVPGRPGGLGWSRDGLLLVVAMERRSIMSLVPGGCPSLYADLSQLMPAYASAMLVDPLGRAYVANFGFDHNRGEAPIPTRLVRVDPDGTPHVQGPELTFPTGMVLLDGGRTMVVAETLDDRLTAMSVAPTGCLGEPRVLADLPPGSGPQGLALDGPGRIWVACAGSGRALAVTPAGEIDAEIEVAGEGVYCAAVGGAQAQTLYLSIASPDVDLAARTPTGRIEAFAL
jgi:sugar lactone lactonase YvrE